MINLHVLSITFKKSLFLFFCAHLFCYTVHVGLFSSNIALSSNLKLTFLANVKVTAMST